MKFHIELVTEDAESKILIWLEMNVATSDNRVKATRAHSKQPVINFT